ncbi:hypothetical protein MHPYR_140087 [uncultured Mycobacterium sp.]|uniref:Uncharacterized protein n=1 Tax=uncultured Mycobacterium sp. TaxID=171292 RepID=A0A1Y5P1U6_9MYCO|nr:hypothetical protein MHPYR_140087 [uncultured Mycobacterium sp.]
MLKAGTSDRVAIYDQSMKNQFGSRAAILGALGAMQRVADQRTVAMSQASGAFSAASYHASFLTSRPAEAPLPRGVGASYFRL